jgi:hypothetical protein
MIKSCRNRIENCFEVFDSKLGSTYCFKCSNNFIVEGQVTPLKIGFELDCSIVNIVPFNDELLAQITGLFFTDKIRIPYLEKETDQVQQGRRLIMQYKDNQDKFVSLVAICRADIHKGTAGEAIFFAKLTWLAFLYELDVIRLEAERVPSIQCDEADKNVCNFGGKDKVPLLSRGLGKLFTVGECKLICDGVEAYERVPYHPVENKRYFAILRNFLQRQVAMPLRRDYPKMQAELVFEARLSVAGFDLDKRGQILQRLCGKAFFEVTQPRAAKRSKGPPAQS